ncbi:MAG: hypothetical protein HBSAPP03_20780 [Phycisphaerae bacterium]|nr:MAG: hypothetical protein HBSAPP03_20780 [Phycisphaerae bacterium]
MSDSRPDIIAIAHDDHYAEHVGRLADGRQFFVTTPFVTAFKDSEGREFLAVYVFDAEGNLLSAQVDDLGPRSKLDEIAAGKLHSSRLQELGPRTSADIAIKPFSVERFGTTFGLILQEPEDEDDGWCATVEPGNYMAFYEPWDGTYDT